MFRPARTAPHDEWSSWPADARGSTGAGRILNSVSADARLRRRVDRQLVCPGGAGTRFNGVPDRPRRPAHPAGRRLDQAASRLGARRSSAYAIWVNWGQSRTTKTAEPMKANQNGAVTPKWVARVPPSAEPTTSPPKTQIV
jgi:hypothetical protein